MHIKVAVLFIYSWRCSDGSPGFGLGFKFYEMYGTENKPQLYGMKCKTPYTLNQPLEAVSTP